MEASEMAERGGMCEALQIPDQTPYGVAPYGTLTSEKTSRQLKYAEINFNKM